MGGEPIRPRRRFVAELLGRPLLFVLWSLVLWGTLLVLGVSFTLLTRGAGQIGPLAKDAWGWLNLVSVVLAVLAWGALLRAVRLSRR